MSTQTERPTRKPSRNKSAKSGRQYSKQTAHVEARRDGKPLIFGWGKHLSHTEKVRIQRRATWGLAVFIVLLLAAVLVGSWINLNIIIPGQAITSVNGHAIPQSEYRTMVAVKTQLALNQLYGPNGLTNQVTNLQTQQAQAKVNKDNDKYQALQKQIDDLNNNQIPQAKQSFTQSEISNDSVNWLQEDELIREWLATQPVSVQNKINPTATQLNGDFNSLKKNMPTNNGYNTIFSSMGISDSDIRAMLTIVDRRNNLQSYLSLQLTSPSRQVQARQMVLPTQQAANQVLQDLQKGQDFAKLASANSQDNNTKAKGGDLGWLTRYQYIDPASNVNGSPVIDNWIFDSARKLNETSPVLYANSAYYIVQITGIDPARAVDATLLKALQGNALPNWLQERRALPGQKITSPDQNKLNDPNNLPPNNILPSAAPSGAPGTAPGSTGGY